MKSENRGVSPRYLLFRPRTATDICSTAVETRLRCEIESGRHGQIPNDPFSLVYLKLFVLPSPFGQITIKSEKLTLPWVCMMGCENEAEQIS